MNAACKQMSITHDGRFSFDVGFVRSAGEVEFNAHIMERLQKLACALDLVIVWVKLAAFDFLYAPP